MKDLMDIAKTLIVLGTLALNSLLIYLLLYQPFNQILNDPSHKYFISEENSFIKNTTPVTIFLLILTSLILVIKIYKKEKVFFIAPAFTLLVFAVWLCLHALEKG